MEYEPIPAHYSKVMVNQQLTFTVLSWLREFRFSSPHVISRLIDVPMPYNSNLRRFMKRLIDRDLVEVFYSNRSPKLGILFRLGREAPAFMELHGLPHDRTYVHPKSLEASKTIYHDLNVQMAAFGYPRLVTTRNRAEEDDQPVQDENTRIYEILGEGHLSENARGLPQPDMILASRRRRVAYEYEMTRKTNARIYFAFTNHLRAIREGHYYGVCYMFPNTRIRDTYEALYMEALWPETSRYSDGRVITHGHPFNPDEIFPRGNPREKGTKAIQFTVENYISPISGREN